MDTQMIDTTQRTEPAKGESLSFKNEDFAADMARLAAEQGVANPLEVKAEAPAPVAVTMPKADAPAQPEAPAAVTPEATAKAETAQKAEAPVVATPDKFKTPDGQLDTAKVLKSTIEADKALAIYLAKEKELKRKMNEVKQAENAYLNPGNPPATQNLPASTITPAQAQAVPFEQQLEADVQAHGLGKTLAKLFTAAQDSALDMARKELNPLKEGIAENTTRQQIEAIGKADPWVYTEEGVNTLNTILNEQPYMLQAADPYKAAYIYHQGLRGVTQITGAVPQGQQISQVLTPTPTAKAPAPVPAAVAANSAPKSDADTINLNDPVAVNAYVAKLTPAQQDQFYQRAGFPAFRGR
jgi:hypothetical protein